jgi:hypothetical protein
MAVLLFSGERSAQPLRATKEQPKVCGAAMTTNRPLEYWGQVLGDTAAGRGHPGPLPAPCRCHPAAGQELPDA